MIDKIELDNAVKMLQHAKWSNGHKILKINGAALLLVVAISIGSIVYGRNLLSIYNKTSYRVGSDWTFWLLCGRTDPITNVCALDQIAPSVYTTCLEKAKDLCLQEDLANYLLLTLSIISMMLMLSIPLTYIYRPLREYRNHYLKDLSADNQTFLQKCAERFGINISNESSITEALQLFQAKLSSDLPNENVSFNFFARNVGDYKTMNHQKAELENFQLEL